MSVTHLLIAFGDQVTHLLFVLAQYRASHRGIHLILPLSVCTVCGCVN